MINIFEHNSIRSRMLSGFLFLSFIIVLLTIVSLNLLNKTQKIAKIHSNITLLQVYTLNLIKTDNDYFDIESTNELYFKTHQSKFINQRDSLLKLINQLIVDVLHESKENNYPVQKNVVDIDSLVMVYNKAFAKIELLTFEKGFRDYGMEGKMRFHAHNLESLDLEVSMIDLLMLRRIEKDFFLRHDTAYISNFNRLMCKVQDNMNPTSKVYTNVSTNLAEYKKYFNNLAKIQQEIGTSSTDGLLWQLNNLTTSLSNQYFALAEYSNQLYNKLQKEARLFYILLTIGALMFSLITGFWISKKLSEPIARLSTIMNNSVTLNSNNELDITFPNAATEINVLTTSFRKLISITNQQINEIQNKSLLVKTQNMELQKLNNELDSFLYSTAHDLRSPLTSLLGLLRLMRIENKQETLLPYLEKTQSSINRMEDFIAQIVDYSKNKKMDVLAEHIDMHRLINDIFESHQFVGVNFIEKLIQIKEPYPFFSDKTKIQIIFNNLISNAIRYADAEKENSYIRIDIRINSNEIEIEFADNGVGIDQEHVPRIFEMFYRANFNSKGSGLGLFIFKEAITKLNGFVSVESNKGEGTKFFIRLPNLYQLRSIHALPFAEVN